MTTAKTSPNKTPVNAGGKSDKPAKVNKTMLALAQERIFGTIQEMDDMMAMLNVFSGLGHQMFYRETSDYENFFQGLQMMRQALRSKYAEQIMSCMPLVGAGGEAAKKFSHKQFLKYFGEDTCAVHRYLTKYGVTLGWASSEEASLREELHQRKKEILTADSEPTRKLTIKRPSGASGDKTSDKPKAADDKPTPKNRPAKKSPKRPAIVASIADMLDRLHPAQVEPENDADEIQSAPWPADSDDDLDF